jgi:hypothetical protein
VFDGPAVKQLYEKMRMIAITPIRAERAKNSFGESILGNRGLLAWAKTCSQLQMSAPESKPAPLANPRCNAGADIGSQLKNIMTQMALQFVEGA